MSYWRSTFQVPDRRPPWQWAAERMALKGSPFGKRFMPDLTPWLKEPLEVIADNRNQEITCQCCVQGGKTTILTVVASWATEFQPDAMMITCQTDDDAKFLAKERIKPALESIPTINGRLSADTSKNSTLFISMADMFIVLQGANQGNLQSKPVRWVLNDEVYLWKNGFLQQSRNRATRFWNRRIFNASTAGDLGCDLDIAHKSGDQRESLFQCWKCREYFIPKFDCVKYPKQDDWDWRLLRESTYLECPLCTERYAHTLENHRRLVTDKYRATNLKPSPGRLSFHWGAQVLSPSEYSWGEMAEEWVKAEIEFNKGNDAPRKEFITKRLAESYDPNRFLVTTKLPTIEISDWPEEAFRFLTVDVQEIEFWATVRAWSKDGSSRLLWAGKLLTYEEIEEKSKEFRVPAGCVFLDSSWDTRKVYLECAKRNELLSINGRQDWMGWKALNGEAEARKNFVYKPAKGKPVLLPYSYPAKYVDPMAGRAAHERRYAKLYFWSNIAIKDILKRLRDGKGAPWLAYEGAPKDWNEQMFSERRIAIWDKYNKESYKWERIGKRANHLWDCECMQVVAACIAGCIGDSTPQEAEAP